MFGYLNVHSHYSLLRGVSKIPRLIEKAKKEGCQAIALTDTNNLYGAIEFYKLAKKENIKPLIGVTIHVKYEDVSKIFPIQLIAKNNEGYKNILTIVTVAQFTNDKSPRIEIDKLKKITKGVICILPSLYNRFLYEIVESNKENAEKILNEYKAIFNDFYVGISPQDKTQKDGTHVEDKTSDVIKICDKTNTPIVLNPLIYLIDEDDVDARSVLVKIQNPILSQIEEDLFKDDLIFPNKDEIIKWAKEIYPNSLINLEKIINDANVDIKLGDWFFSIPKIEDGVDHIELFKKYIEDGYKNRGVKKTKDVEERVNFEFDVINKKGYISYFLTVIDIINFMHENKILTTTRGSAAGSMISYLTGITNINPMEYKISFERFLNSHRPSAPDIDIDIADNRRLEVIDYIINAYGKDKVAQIGTLGTMMARAAIRDTSRALGYSYITGDRIAKLIPIGMQGMPSYINDSLKKVVELSNLYKNDSDVKKIIDVAKKIEGNARHLSIHASGIVIAPSTITEFTSLERDENKNITQFNMYSIEDVGLLKYDILGLTYLSILSASIELVKKKKNIDIDIENIPLDDKKTYKLLHEGYTTGIFQLGSKGINFVVKGIKPSKLYDIASIIALYRPGPIQNISEYIKRKNGEKEITYIHPKMKDFLKDSYGVLVFQDDVLYTALELAGYNWEQVDVFRKAIGKKIPKLMNEQEIILKKGLKENTDLKEKDINKIWELFEPFKGYGFGKAHAMSYAKVSYQTAYMKANYTAEYLTAHLSAASGEVDSVSDLIHEARKLKLKILPPHVNESNVEFDTEGESIRIGLCTIKQVGISVGEAIVKEREENGNYVSIENFLTRLSKYLVINSRNLKALIKVGVFDDFKDRSILLHNIDLLLECVKCGKKQTNEQNLFSQQIEAKINLKPVTEEVEKIQQLYWEKELLGLYISGHPLDTFKREGLYISDVKRRTTQSKVLITAVIGSIKPFKNKSGEKMLFMTLEDDINNKIEAVCFPHEVEKYEELLALYRPVKVRGSISIRNDEVSLRIDSIENPIFVG